MRTAGTWSLDNLSTSGYLLGKAVGWEDAAAWLRKLSGDSFARGDDALAKWQREGARLAAIFGENERATLREHEKDFPSQLEKP